MGIPNTSKTEAGTVGTKRKPTPDSGYYRVPAGEFCKQFRLNNGKMSSRLKNGQWFLPVTLPGDWSTNVFVNHYLNDDGTPRQDLNDNKREFFEQLINTLIDAAGAEDLDGVENSTITVKWQDASLEAFKAGVKGRLDPVSRAEYDKAVAEGWTVDDIPAPQDRATQQVRTTAPPTATTTPNPYDEEPPF